MFFLPGHEQGVPSLAELQGAAAIQDGLPSLEIPGETHLGGNGVQLRQGLEVAGQLGQRVTHSIGEEPQDVFFFPFFLIDQEV